MSGRKGSFEPVASCILHIERCSVVVECYNMVNIICILYVLRTDPVCPVGIEIPFPKTVSYHALFFRALQLKSGWEIWSHIVLSLQWDSK